MKWDPCDPFNIDLLIGNCFPGTYLCAVRDSKKMQDNKMVIERVDLLVLEKPQISIDFMKAVGAKKIFLNWTVSGHHFYFI